MFYVSHFKINLQNSDILYYLNLYRFE